MEETTIINLKETLFELANARKVLEQQQEFLFDQHFNWARTENNELARKYIDIQEEAISNELKKVKKQTKEIIAKISLTDLEEWSKEYKLRG